MTDKDERFMALIEENYTWPDYYGFKFIVAVHLKDELISQLEGHEIQYKFSQNSNYVSITSRKLIQKTDEVIEVYRRISKIPGVMSF